MKNPHKKRNWVFWGLNAMIFFLVVPTLALVGWAIFTWYSEPIFWIIFLTIHIGGTMLIALDLAYFDYYGEYKFFWLFAVVLVPVWSIFAYLLFGNFRRLKVWKKRNYQTKLNYDVKSYGNSQLFANSKLSQKIQNLFLYAAKITNYNSWPNTKKNVYFQPFDKFAQIKKDLNGAKSYILLNYYIIADSDCFNFLYETFLDNLKRGVKIKIIYDYGGKILNQVPGLLKNLIKKGAQVKANGSFWPFDINLIYRSHRKDLIIDGKIAYTGGYNIGDEYCHMSDSYGYWQDTHLRIEGAAARHLELIFERDWLELLNKKEKISYEKKMEKVFAKQPKTNLKTITDLTHIVADYRPKKLAISRNLILETMNTAEKRIWIMSPFLIVDNEFKETLIRHSKKGIDVRIILTKNTSKWIVNTMRLEFQAMIDAGVKIYEFNGYLHSKMVLVDDGLVLTGTANFDFFSFYWSKQTIVLIYDKKLNQLIAQESFEEDFQMADLLTASPLTKMRWWKIIWIKICALPRLFV